MAASKIESRLAALEERVAQLEQRANAASAPPKNWTDDVVGAFAGDLDFLEAMRLGREYRESLRPKPRKRTTRK